MRRDAKVARQRSLVVTHRLNTIEQCIEERCVVFSGHKIEDSRILPYVNRGRSL